METVSNLRLNLTHRAVAFALALVTTSLMAVSTAVLSAGGALTTLTLI